MAWARTARFPALAALAALAAAAPCVSLQACSTDVNLGGTDDAGAADVVPGPEELAALCEPCATVQACPAAATCVYIASKNTYCATACPQGTECNADESCQLAGRGPDGVLVPACLPAVGVCAPAKPPVSDSALVVHCGTLDGPTVVATCKSCDKDDKDCQQNGCYGGWWCNATTHRCQKPPATCP